MVGCGDTGPGETPSAPEASADVVRARDAAVTFVREHFDEAPEASLSWVEERLTPEGSVGGEEWQYRAGDWTVKVSHGMVAGGLQVLLEAELPPEEAVDPVAMEVTRAIIERRVNGLGVSEPLIQLLGSRRIVVNLPPIEDPQRAIETFGKTGLLEFIEAGHTYLPPGTVVTTNEVVAQVAPVTPTVSITPTPEVTPTLPVTPTAPTEPAGPVYETVLTGRHLTRADKGLGELGLIEIQLELNDEGAVLFGECTRAHVGQVMCIVLDKQVVSCATINEAILDGRVRITREGGFPPEEAESIVIRLRYGALPIPLRVVEARAWGEGLPLTVYHVAVSNESTGFQWEGEVDAQGALTEH